MLLLAHDTPIEWTEAVLADFDAFLQDHAANERKASAAAMRLAVHHFDVPHLVDAMVEVAGEELEHFRQVYEVLRSRGTDLGQDAPDPYMTRMHGLMRKERKSQFLLDRLLVFSLIEARGCERFGLLAEVLEPGAMKDFYAELTRAEARHRGLFVRLARELFASDEVNDRLQELVAGEAEIAATLPFRAALH